MNPIHIYIHNEYQFVNFALMSASQTFYVSSYHGIRLDLLTYAFLLGNRCCVVFICIITQEVETCKNT